jgi:hypothetical protein
VILYFAGNLQTETLELIARKAMNSVVGVPTLRANNFLFSFADPGAQTNAKHFCVQPQRRIFVDSGAYTAWSKNKIIKLDEYIAFCKDIMSMAKCPVVFAALDVIPGKKSDVRKPTEIEKEKACVAGWENYQQMKRQGIPCLMTYHQGEHVRWLARIADESDYFAVSPRKNGVSSEQKMAWLRKTFEYIYGDNPRLEQRKKIHGLGVCGRKFMKEIPFYSVDSTAWLVSMKTSQYRMPGGKYVKLQDMEERARQQKVDPRPLRQLMGISLYGEKPDPEGNSGPYFLATIAMSHELEIQYRVTEHWRDRGIVWDDQHDIAPVRDSRVLI